MDLSNLFLASLNPQTRSQAESSLTQASTQPQFVIYVLQLVLDTNQQKEARQAACVYFKNTVRRRWNAEETEEPPIAPDEKATIRAQLVKAMISLSSPSDKLLRAQIGEAVGLVAAVDFPTRWEDLIDQLVSHLSPADYGVNLSILETAHSIFVRWRSQMRSNELFTTINYVVERFGDAFFAIFRSTANILLTTPPSSIPLPTLQQIAQSQALLTSLYYDLTDQDIPPSFEDAVPEFFGVDGGDGGWFLKLVKWDPVELRGDPDDATPTAPMQIRTRIFEITEMFTMKYNELFGSRMPSFVQAVWELIGASSSAEPGALLGSGGSAVREDYMVSQAIRFLSVAVKSGLHSPLFAQQTTLVGLCERIVLPSMGLREHEVEQFEDDPLEYIRRDLSLGSEAATGSEATRRHAASELLRSLCGISGDVDKEVTRMVQGYIAAGLQSYAQNPSGNWKAKDAAIYLLSAIAIKSSTMQHGVTSVNLLVDIVQFFSEHIAQDLQQGSSLVHPILQVDAIRFLYMFRYQLTKEQLLSILPLLVRHLGSENYVCYTYTAITIERILFMKKNNQVIFNHVDIQAFSNDILTTLFAKIESGGTPEKVAENDYLMKCVMRTIITANKTLAPIAPAILAKLVQVLGIISKNPSNPKFNQYTFESISALLRFTILVDAATITQFEEALFGPITFIIQQDIAEFIPYVFQILSQMLEAHSVTLPEAYRSLLPLLLNPATWASRGNVPALVRLINAYLAKDSVRMATTGELQTVFGIIQQRLIPSKLNDQYGFELLQTAIRIVPHNEMKKYFRGLLVTLFTRLQSSKTDKFSYMMAYYFTYAMAIQADGWTPDFVIGEVEGIQNGLWGQLYGGIILPEIPKMRKPEQKVAIIGMTRLLAQSKLMLTHSNAQLWPKSLNALLQLATSSGLSKSNTADEDDPDVALTSIDYEEANAGYQASFSKLTASQPVKVDPVAYVADAQVFMKEELVKAVRLDGPGLLRTLISQADQTPTLQAVFSG